MRKRKGPLSAGEWLRGDPVPADVPAGSLVYRLYDRQGRLLYVGSSDELGRRLTRHATNALWWRNSERITWERWGSRSDALWAESRAIWNERPMHNVVGANTDEPIAL